MTAFGLTGGGAVVLGVATAWAVNKWVVDPLYNVTKKNVGNAVSSFEKWVGNLFG